MKMYQIIIKMKDGRRIKHKAKIFKIHNFVDKKIIVQIELSEDDDELFCNLHWKIFTYAKEDIKNIKIKESD